MRVTTAGHESRTRSPRAIVDLNGRHVTVGWCYEQGVVVSRILRTVVDGVRENC